MRCGSYVRLSFWYALLLLSACSDPIAPSLIALSGSGTDTLSAIGQQLQINAAVRGAKGQTLLDLPLAWTASDTSVITVDSQGLVTAVGPGTATVTVNTEVVAASTTVVVHQVVAQVAVSVPMDSLIEVDTVQATATVFDANSFRIYDRLVVWTSGDSVRATITSDGMVVTSRRGLVVISATVGEVTGSAELVVDDGFLANSVTGASTTEHACVVDLDAMAYCWVGSAPAVREGGDHTWQSVSVGYRHVCGIAGDSTVWCWGYNIYAQLGNGSNTPDWTDEPLHSFGGLVALAVRATAHDFSCAITPEMTPLCWGHNDFGQLGRGTRSGYESDAGRPTGTFLLTSVDGDIFHACGITPGGDAWCWGGLGVAGDNEYSETPSLVPGGHTFTSLSTGGHRTCALTTAGVPYCWGKTSLGGATRFVGTPFVVAGGPPFVSLSVGQYHTCALTAEGELWCWEGWKSGLLKGDSEYETPTAYPTSLRFRTVAVRSLRGSTCGVTRELAVYCWTAAAPEPQRILRSRTATPAPIRR